jgi:uncharacterized phiE125 gp8 family phage protein
MTTNWTIRRTSPVTNLPVTLEEIKSHLRLNASDTTHDANLTLLAEAAAERLEQDIDRQLINATYLQTQFDWNGKNGEIKLRSRAVSNVASVVYVDEDGVTQTLDSAAYIFDQARGSLFPAPGTDWPCVQPDNPSAISISFTAGYGDDADCMPRLFKTAMLLGVGKWFFDPAQEGSALHSQEVAYEKIVTLLMRSSYP